MENILEKLSQATYTKLNWRVSKKTTHYLKILATNSGMTYEKYLENALRNHIIANQHKILGFIDYTENDLLSDTPLNEIAL